MNCQKGDLAVIVDVIDEPLKDNIGIFVDVLEFLPTHKSPAWLVKPRAKTMKGALNGVVQDIDISRVRTITCHDSCLKPIRPPGTTTKEKTDDSLHSTRHSLLPSR